VQQRSQLTQAFLALVTQFGYRTWVLVFAQLPLALQQLEQHQV
jgi:hypothetical protein